ncbi:MAG: right-handed parallel beta-helix repeat-containing protein [Acidimicrobiia bacterium]|nr:right-handed parallel beta-helix repeat-containing protein [Acidimicrobiia bacterium]
MREDRTRLIGWRRATVAAIVATTAVVAVLAAMAVPAPRPASATSTVLVDAADPTPDAGGCGTTTNPCDTIQTGIHQARAGDTVAVAPGTYAERLVLDKPLALLGARAGTDARGRTGEESVVTAPYGTLLTLRLGAAGASVDGFTFRGGYQAVAATGGPLDGLSIVGNRVEGPLLGTIRLMGGGTDVTLARNVIESGTSFAEGIALGADPYDGFWLVDNELRGAPGSTTSGFLTDGDRNVGPSATRSPRIEGNVVSGWTLGMDLGRASVDMGVVAENVLGPNAWAGLQGGPRGTRITGNTFRDNGWAGLALTGYGGADDPDRGAQDNTVEHNTFTGNGMLLSGPALYVSDDQYPGTVSTNRISRNDVAGNARGAVYEGAETVELECNWWGAPDGPSGAGPGSGDPVVGASVAVAPWLSEPFAAGEPCPAPAAPTARSDCLEEGWTRYTALAFRNQGDCVSFVATGGRNGPVAAPEPARGGPGARAASGLATGVAATLR